jgi:hypothetical protein
MDAAPLLAPSPRSCGRTGVARVPKGRASPRRKTGAMSLAQNLDGRLRKRCAGDPAAGVRATAGIEGRVAKLQRDQRPASPTWPGRRRRCDTLVGRPKQDCHSLGPGSDRFCLLGPRRTFWCVRGPLDHCPQRPHLHRCQEGRTHRKGGVVHRLRRDHAELRAQQGPARTTKHRRRVDVSPGTICVGSGAADTVPQQLWGCHYARRCVVVNSFAAAQHSAEMRPRVSGHLVGGASARLGKAGR